MPKCIKLKSNDSTAEIADRIFKQLQIADYERREAMNYPPEFFYFKARSGDCDIQIYASDDEEKCTHCIWLKSLDQQSEQALWRTILEILKNDASV